MESSSTSIILIFAGLIMLIGGLTLFGVSLKYRTENCPPIPSMDRKAWKPFWKTQNWFKSKGYHIYVSSSILLVLGSLSIGVGFLVRVF